MDSATASDSKLLEVNLTPEDTSEFLRVPLDTLQAWRTTKRVRLPYFKIGGHVRYPLSGLQEFIAKNTQGA